MVKRKVKMSTDGGYNVTVINDISNTFDRLKISILTKASQVSGKSDVPTLGRDAISKNSHALKNKNKIQSVMNSSPLNKISSRSNIAFSIKKMLLENEVQRREKVKKIIECKKQEMENSQKSIRKDLAQLLSRIAIQRKKKTAQKLALLEAEEKQIAQQLEMYGRNEVQRQRIKEREEIFKKIIPYQENFNAKWKDIATITSTCHDKNSAISLLAPHIAKLKELSLQMDSLNEKAKMGKLSLADIKMAKVIVQLNDEIFQSFKADIYIIEILHNAEITRRKMEVKQAELKAREETMRIKQPQHPENFMKNSKQFIRVEEQMVNKEQDTYNEQNKKRIIIPQPVALSPAIEVTPVKTSKSPDHRFLQIYSHNHQFLETHAAKYQDFIQSETMKKFKFECQKSVNITINSISHTSREQLLNKYEKLKLFISDPSVSQNPQVEAYCKNLLAQKIVDQGDTTISIKPELAFSFAAVTVALWNDWPDFGDLLLARIREKSPLFIPLCPLPNKDQSEEDYYKILGCKYTQTGTLEKSEYFWKRLGGIMYLYASIIVTRQRLGVDKPHPHGPKNALRWLAATINIEPRCDIADICATLIHSILEVTGNDLWKTYPSQFPKMLLKLNVYYTKLKNLTAVISAPISRLGNFLSTALKAGSIPPPRGQLTPNFW